MAVHGDKIVWILGAGASVGLGGPTLQSLLSRSVFTNNEARYKTRYPKLMGNTPFQTVRLYHYGRGWPEGPIHNTFDAGSHGEHLWSHAEEFMEYLDMASTKEHSALAARLELTLDGPLILPRPGYVKPSAAEMSAAARRLVAAECCAFLENANIASERWAPYVRWANSLRAQDTVVTFNYDRVLEKIDAKYTMVVTGADQLTEAREAKRCPILKLHGSVDWKLKSNAIEAIADPEFALSCEDVDLAIATPGPKKATHSKSPAFASLWSAAETALKAADAIVFVGYRFPPTDAIARDRLLGAIGQTAALAFHVVLGNSPSDAARLEAMVEFVRPERNRGTLTRIHPLFAEDFFAVVRRAKLLLQI